MATCFETNVTRRSLFWATQPDACGTELVCGASCGTPGLSIADGVVATNDWVRGLIINMLMTDGRETVTPCGVRPGAQGGHWSESYIDGGPSSVGSLLRTVPATGTTDQQVAMIVAFAQATLERLVARGVASKVTATGSYTGNSVMSLSVEVVGSSGSTTNVNIAGSRNANYWVWN